ncbi:MAG: M1 family aminopeptidase [Actinomycetota bacterium]|nr:M1 family aminopeptidase [Actinomycetota bacterium]
MEESDTSICKSCGFSNPASNSFCLRCGKPLEPQGNSPKRNSEEKAPNEIQEKQTSEEILEDYICGKKSGKKGSRKLRIAALVVVALCLIAAITFVTYITLCKPPVMELPETKRELENSRERANSLLTQKGLELISGKDSKEATVYSVGAKLDEKNQALRADMKVLFTNRTAGNLDEIVFRVYPLQISKQGENEVSFSIEKAGVNGKKVRASTEGSLLHVPFVKNLSPGSSALVEITFNVKIPKIEAGLGGLLEGITGTSNYGIFGREEKTYNLGYFFPLVTSFRNGEWEKREPPRFGDMCDFESSYFNVAIEVPDNFTVAASGYRTSEKSGGGKKVSTFIAGPSRDFCIQTSPDYKTSKKKVRNTEISHYYLASRKETSSNVLDCAVKAFKQYEKHFGDYPYKTLNICETPMSGNVSGLEFSGHIMLSKTLYGEVGILEEKMPESLKNLPGILDMLSGGYLENTLEFVIAHEVSHQWWGEVVGSDSIGHAWQDESLANMSSLLFFRWQYGEDAEKKALERNVLLEYSAAKLLGSQDAVVDQPSKAFSSEREYMSAVYVKGTIFFMELEKTTGAKVFEKASQEYYRTYSFEEAMPEDLINIFKVNFNRPEKVDSLYRRWIKEKHASADIKTILPEVPSNIEDLLKEFLREDGTDLGPLEDMLKNLQEDSKISVPVPLENQQSI